ncbi:hypothetical protein MMAG44476_07731 [Mycolicibacterium mageritense DSM 44476 = CIP 104973]|uniref:ESX-1 secretion-associated protein n=1 Tax=Mycolicibacterium mageritense TaxID=53462 RepID=A0AAI8TSY3_MYCME|nr:ESX-1 secretion-associated protein [Mycobacterium sp. DSM 3803]OKH68241.1 hypothetical protein EB73_16200 [Mycobacterium sp. SWH-M3]TXI60505.1 MAG: ESX-1 secretion-associated protein [Mycolicibacterium mageritense]CDO21434.1 hypothetical protein BN978_01895 [Mycolicibacterium mageritense DSM 44476 = CIP 104973]BBX32999.1 ESX-1 secretion-associated protein [Mycolicibacterium mageritense]
MSGDLRVTTAHLRELSAKQGQACAELTTATAAVADVDTSVHRTHGPISWSTAGAVAAAVCARRAAGDSVARVSHGLSRRLTAAAATYDQTDAAHAARMADCFRHRSR